MKKVSLFAKIVYYLFTFSVGILLAIFLPFVYMYDGEALNIIQQSLDSGGYSQAMAMVGGYYNKELVLNEGFETGGGIVLFESATLYNQTYGEGDEAVTQYKMHKSYSGFVHGLDKEKFAVDSFTENKTKLLINTSSGQKEFEILNCDTDGDTEFDNVSSLLSNNFFFIELSEEEMQTLGVSDIISLTFVIADGSEYGTVKMDNETFKAENLFKTDFFVATNEFIEKNNELADHTALNKEEPDYQQKIESLGVQLGALDASILENENYEKSNTDIAKTSADKRASRTVIIYFVCIYVIGDFILGTKYILKFIKWFGSKVLKIKPKEREVDKELFGYDYYSQVEIKLESVNLEAEDEVRLTYFNEKASITFTFNYVNGYTDKQRMKAGRYDLQLTDLQEKYNVEFIPQTIIVEGYQKSITAKIIRREEERS